MEIDYLPWTLAERFGGRAAVADERLSLSFKDLDARAEGLAEQLQELGFVAGDVLGVMLPNRVELVVALGAAWRLGGAVTPINPAFTPSEARHQIEDSGARLVITDGDGPALSVPTLQVTALRAAAAAPVPPVRLSGEEVALVIYTSGSTGRPKGVMLDHANCDAMSAQMARHLELTDEDHCMLVLPLFHVNAIMVSTLAPLRVGGRLSMLSGFSASTFFDSVERLRPTYFSAVPTIYALLASLPQDVRPDTSSLRFVVCGAAPVTQELLEASEQRYGFRMVEGYGLTEGTCCSACNPVNGVRKLGTVGRAMPGQRIRIIAPDGRELPVGQSGEVLIAGPTVMRGYLGNREATDRTVVDGWLHTGDVGVLDEDGYLKIVDRIKDMIIRGGENLYPKEIEAAIAAFEGVLEVAVVGRPDPVMGEVPVAFVVPYPDADVTPERLLEHCRALLTRVKVPAEIVVLDSLPKNPVGKVDKPGLRKQLQPV
jgi:long-chain acyl-CoA synthetase